MRAHRRARRNRRPRLFVRRLGVADGRHDARIDDLPDRREGAVAFRRDGDHPDRARRPHRERGRSRAGRGHASATAGARRTARSTATDLRDGCRRSGPARTSSANSLTWRSNSAGPAVTREATSVVVPCLRCSATAVAVSAGDAAEKFAPPPPCRWVSTKPGTTVAAPRSRSAGRGGGPEPIAATVGLRDLNPAGPQQFSAGEQRVDRQQHSDALPVRLRQVRLAVVVDQLKPTGRSVVEQHRHMRVMLQDARGPHRASPGLRRDGERPRPCHDRSPPRSRAGPP